MIEINGRSYCENCFGETKERVCPHCGCDLSEFVSDPTLLAPGSVLFGKYIIGNVIGKGGFGVTYLALDTVSKRKVAVKEYFPYALARRAVESSAVTVTFADGREAFELGAEKFYEEARVVSKFKDNPNIVKVYEYFYENDTAYLVMEYLNGQILKEYIRDNGTITAPQALHIALSIVNALEQAHKASILHRDISPDNIILCSNGTVKLIDFGAARQVVVELSQSFSVIVKPGFAPLEQYNKKGKQGPWTDIYSLGATLYFALTGDIPDDPLTRFDDDDTFKENLFDIEPKLWRIIKKAASLKNEDRYKNAEEMLTDLKEAGFEPLPVIPPKNAEGTGHNKLHGGVMTAGSFDYRQHLDFSWDSVKERVVFSDGDKDKVLYATLYEERKELYELIYNCVANSDEAVELAPHTYDGKTVSTVYQRVLYDNPQFYYAGDCDVEPCEEGSDYIAKIKPLYADVDREAMENEVKEVVRVSRKDNTIDTLCAIHNNMIATVKVVGRDSDLLSSSAYGAAINKYADDIGYAKAFCYYVQTAGLPCYVVEGEYMGQPRAWCRFKLENDIWYNADVYGDKFAASLVTKLKLLNDSSYFKTFFLTNDDYMMSYGYTLSPEYSRLLQGEYRAASPKGNYYFQRNRKYYYFSGPDATYNCITTRLAKIYSAEGQNGVAIPTAPFVVDRLYDKINERFLIDMKEIYGIEETEFTMQYAPDTCIVHYNKNWVE